MHEDRLNEQVSALADDELDRDERGLLLRRLAADPVLRERWSTYLLIRDALRGHLPHGMRSDFAGTLATRMASDPQSPAAVIAAPMLRRVAGLAVAATVAVVALVSLHVGDPVLDAPPEAVTVVPVTVVQQVPPVRFAVSPAMTWERAQPEVQVILNQYLLTHSDAADVEPVPDENPD